MHWLLICYCTFLDNSDNESPHKTNNGNGHHGDEEMGYIDSADEIQPDDHILQEIKD